jgi:hypothetical protein
MEKTDEAIAAYGQAISNLQSLRSEPTGCCSRFDPPVNEIAETVSFDLVDLLLEKAAGDDEDETSRREHLQNT